jgi:protease-4
MSLETDLLLDRRRLKRRLFAWQVLAGIALIAAALVAVGRPGIPRFGGHLARLSVNGLITDDRELSRTVAALADDGRVAGLIVAINSPGGSVAGGEGLHDAIARVAAKKPVVAVMGGTAASAGYMVALPAVRIFARDSTLTGSIGVLLQTGEISGLLSHLGVTADAITSGPLKDQPSMVRPLTPEGRQVLQGLVNDLYEQFVAMVAAGRHMTPDQVRPLADGRAYTGRQALKLGLIDAIGGEKEAREWLATARQVPTDLPVEDVGAAGFSLTGFGARLGLILEALQNIEMIQGLRIDGAWAVWQPGLR